MSKKKKSVKEAIAQIKPGASVMIGGFLGVGTPEILIDELVTQGTGNLTVIANDSGTPGKGVSKLIATKQVSKLITSHIGLNPETGKQMNEGTLEVELVPQGTLAEKIRSAGAGLGGVLTPTGVGTIVAEGKEIFNIDGKDYLLEKPLKADFALIRSSVCDDAGNTYYHNSTRNFNTIMATAANYVIAATEKLVKKGELDPNHVMTPGIFVDTIVEGEKKCQI